jgi:hypothetical protein
MGAAVNRITHAGRPDADRTGAALAVNRVIHN